MGTEQVVGWVVGYAVNSAWQVPVVLLVGLAAARLARRLGPAVGYRVWVGVLAAAVVLPAVAASGWDVWGGVCSAWEHGWAWLVGAGALRGGGVRVLVGPGAAGGGGLHWAAGLVWAVCAVYAGSVVLGLARLGFGLVRVRGLCRDVVELDAGVLDSGLLNGYADLPRGIRLGEAEGVAGPMVVGVWRPWLLLPVDFLKTTSAEDVQAALAHEVAHVHRGDFAKNLLCRLFALPVSYHPCAWVILARLAESREMACDALAAEAVGGAGRYVGSLLRLGRALPGVSQGRAAGLAVGMLEGNRLERRVTVMMQGKRELNGMVKAAVMAGLLLMTAGAGATVGGMHFRVQGEVEGAHPPAPKTLNVPGGVMAGNLLTKMEPVYPASAKHDKVQGQVVLAMRINKEGLPTNVRVQKSVRADLDESALTAVRQWRYEPYLLNGVPIVVDTTVNVTYSLQK